jgi:hypothetical protein
MHKESDHMKEEVHHPGAMYHKYPAVLSGNAAVDGAANRGWFIGHFLANACGLSAISTVEVKWGACSAGEERSSWGMSEQSTTLCILLKGRMQFSFPQSAHLLTHEGDYLLWPAGIPHHWKALEESCALSVRWPSIP